MGVELVKGSVCVCVGGGGGRVVGGSVIGGVSGCRVNE